MEEMRAMNHIRRLGLIFTFALVVGVASMIGIIGAAKAGFLDGVIQTGITQYLNSGSNLFSVGAAQDSTFGNSLSVYNNTGGAFDHYISTNGGVGLSPHTMAWFDAHADYTNLLHQCTDCTAMAGSVCRSSGPAVGQWVNISSAATTAGVGVPRYTRGCGTGQ